MSALSDDADTTAEDSDSDEAPTLVNDDKEAGTSGTPGPVADRGSSVTPLTAPVTAAKIPVTILCGFLGSGKSSLLRSIVSSDHGLRIAVVENEFGASGGLETVIATQGVRTLNLDGSIVELRNGCVCCTIKGELVQALEALVDQRFAGGRDFDAIVVELSGVANPGPVASSLWLDAALESTLELDAVVCVVDSANLQRTMRSSSILAIAQLALADRILLNKADLVTEKSSLEALVRSHNPAAEVAWTVNGVGDFSVDGWLLRTKCLGAASRRGLEAALATPGNFAAASHAAVSTTVVSSTTAIDRRSLERFLGELLTVADDDDDADTTVVYRAKGAVWLDGGGLHLVQAVYDAFEITPLEDERDKFPGSRLIFLGRQLDPTELQIAFDRCRSIQ